MNVSRRWPLSSCLEVILNFLLVTISEVLHLKKTKIMKTFSASLCTTFFLSQGLTSVLAGYADQVPPLPQPNDVSGTVNGCSSAVLAHDDDGDGAIRRGEYLDFVNNIADLLCLPPRPILDLELQSVFVSISCLCQEREGNDISCCFGESAGLFLDGAGSVVERTEDEQSYLRAACLLTQAVLGPEICQVPTATLNPGTVAPCKGNFSDECDNSAVGQVFSDCVNANQVFSNCVNANRDQCDCNFNDPVSPLTDPPDSCQEGSQMICGAIEAHFNCFCCREE